MYFLLKLKAKGGECTDFLVVGICFAFYTRLFKMVMNLVFPTASGMHVAYRICISLQVTAR